MKQFDSLDNPEIAGILSDGGVGILRTDTLYGVVALASNETAVERVFALKGRDDDKSPIVLIGNKHQLFDAIDQSTKDVLASVWPGPVSVIIPSVNAPDWIQRGNQSVAYRLPDNDVLQNLLNAVGPLIAPSANPQGEPPAMTVLEAIRYFGDNVDFYVNGGQVINPQPSQLLQIQSDGAIKRLR